MLLISVKVSRGGVQINGELGNQSGKRAEGVGWRVGGCRTAWLGHRSSRFPEDDARPSGQKDRQAGCYFFRFCPHWQASAKWQSTISAHI